MCGIVGKVGGKIDVDLIERQIELMNHRGPDSQDIWTSNNGVVLGSARLSIQDLSSNGKMPMKDISGRYVIVFNGEIYNFLELRKYLISVGISFRSNSDTEVLLESYKKFGKHCVNKLKGMFAFCIYDMEEKTLFAARDRIGEKPFYYSFLRNSFAFSSQLNQLIEDKEIGRQLNYDCLSEYLGYGFLSSEDTLIVGIKRLLPGHTLTYRQVQHELVVEKYYEIPEPTNVCNDPDSLVSELDVLLADSVKGQLISDVEAGVLLSGGIDSSLITSYAAEFSTKRVKTFHVSFNNFGSYNESSYAKRVANAFNTEHFELDGSDINYNLIDKVVQYLDEPIADSSMIPTFVVSELVSKNLKVVLGGDGGDELFGGYSKYSKLIHEDSSIRKILPRGLRDTIAYMSDYLPDGKRGKNYLQSIKGDIDYAIYKYRIFDPYSIRKLVPGKELMDKKVKKEVSKDVLYQASSWDMMTYLPNDILTKVDRATMANSLESRTPFLDADIVNFAFARVPSDLKINQGTLKFLPKQLLKQRLPVDLDMNRKQGFSIPLNSWIQGKWYPYIKDDISKLEDLFDRDFTHKLLDNTLKGYSNATRIYAILVLDKWLKANKIRY